jgi:hypothetical protein
VPIAFQIDIRTQRRLVGMLLNDVRYVCFCGFVVDLEIILKVVDRIIAFGRPNSFRSRLSERIATEKERKSKAVNE